MHLKFNKNKVALITGSSKGIGLSIAKLLDSHGVKVLLNSRKKMKKSLISDFKNKPEHFCFDITSSRILKNHLKKLTKI